MNPHQTSPAMAVLFLLSGVAAGNLFLPSLGENGGTEFTPKTDVTVSLSTAKTVFAADEPVLIEVTLKNNMPDGAAKILDWVLPCDAFDSKGEEIAANEGAAPPEMSHFDIRTMGDRVAAYEGAVLKRRAPGEGDYRTLAGGEEYACTVDLGNYYEFDGKDGDDDYEISFAVVSDQLSGPSDGEDAVGRVEILRSNSVELRIDGRTSPSSIRGRPEGQGLEATGSTTFRQCSTSRQTDITSSRTLAVDAAAEVVELLNAVGAARSSSSCPRYEEWFSSYNSPRHQGLETDYNKIHDRLVDASILFDCTCNKQGVYAYVYPSQPYDVYLCPEFWRSEMTGTDSKMGTVIHEISHFTVVAGTDDHAYGQQPCRNLAKNNINKAVKNADNIAYTAENNPALECNTAPPGPTDPPSRAPTKASVACDGLLLTVKVITDDYPDETSYKIKNICTNSVIQKSPVFKKQKSLYEETYCVDDAAYKFIMQDSARDGMCCQSGDGSFAVIYDGTEVASGGQFGRKVTTKPFGNCDSVPTATPTSRPSKAPTKPPIVSNCPVQTLEVNVVTDGYPKETSYTIKNKCTNVVEYTKINFDRSTSNKDTYCLSDAKYEFTIKDKLGDGICCGYGEGSYSVTYKENEIKFNGKFGNKETTSFGGTCGDGGDPCPGIQFKTPCNANTDCVWYNNQCAFKECSVYKNNNRCKRDQTCKWQWRSGTCITR